MMGETRSRLPTLVLAAALAAVAGAAAFAQGAGEVEGQVQDAQGQPLQGVSIKLLKAGKETNQEKTSDAQGSFRFTGLASGVYIAAASREGYAEVTCPGMRVMSGLTRRVAIKLMPADGGQPSSCEAVADGAEPAPPP